MLEFIDFTPNADVSIFHTSVESLESAVAEMNSWLKRNEAVEIINVETLLLPNLHRNGQNSKTPKIRTGGETSSNWYQTVRLWYRRF